MSEHAFWITSRAAGIIALLAASVAVAVGLSRRGRDWRVVHESLSLATMVALAVHAFSLLGDSYLKPSLADVTIPFVSSYGRLWMSAGIVAGWVFVILGLSYYVRARIGVQRWRVLHRFTALAWVLGVVHALTMGTDAGAAWFLLTVALVVIPAAALLVRRIVPTPIPA
jgi:sulfoxide reductase heme-binding subunit YedZ